MRTKYFDVSPELLAQVLISGYRFDNADGTESVVAVSGCPKDARGVRCGLTNDGCVRIVVEHESFPDIYEGMSMERCYVSYSRSRD